jgi:hypothetical protein
MAKEVRFTIDNDFFDSLNKNFYQEKSSTDITRDALNLVQWAIGELSQGNKIVSLDKEQKFREIIMPFQSNVKPSASSQSTMAAQQTPATPATEQAATAANAALPIIITPEILESIINKAVTDATLQATANINNQGTGNTTNNNKPDLVTL